MIFESLISKYCFTGYHGIDVNLMPAENDVIHMIMQKPHP